MVRDDTLFRPRRRPWLRLALAASACVVLASAGSAIIWVRVHIVPPDCAAADTLALVRRSLVANFKLPEHLRIENIQTRAGGYLAFRFACEADLRGIAPDDLPPGTAIPATVYYLSRLSEHGKRHEVAVDVRPLLRLERVQ